MTLQVCDFGLKFFVGYLSYSILTSSGIFSTEGCQRNSAPESIHLHIGYDGGVIISSRLDNELLLTRPFTEQADSPKGEQNTHNKCSLALATFCGPQVDLGR